MDTYGTNTDKFNINYYISNENTKQFDIYGINCVSILRFNESCCGHMIKKLVESSVI